MKFGEEFEKSKCDGNLVFGGKLFVYIYGCLTTIVYV